MLQENQEEQEEDIYELIASLPKDEPIQTHLGLIVLELHRLYNLLSLPAEYLVNGDIHIGVGGDIEVSEKL